MPLTPEDVSNKRFTAVRLREGYDMTEVDQFLDEVEAELARLYRENEELRARLGIAEPASEATTDGTGQESRAESPVESPVESAAPAEEDQHEGATAPTTLEKSDDSDRQPVVADREQVEDDGDRAEPVAEPDAEAVPTPAAASTEPRVERIEVSTTAEASAAATRLLELAGRNADELVDDARAQAQNILSAAQAQAQQLETETAARRQQLFGDLEQEREALATEVESLRTFEQDYRTELRGYFNRQLEALNQPLARLAPLDGGEAGR